MQKNRCENHWKNQQCWSLILRPKSNFQITNAHVSFFKVVCTQNISMYDNVLSIMLLNMPSCMTMVIAARRAVVDLCYPPILWSVVIWFWNISIKTSTHPKYLRISYICSNIYHLLPILIYFYLFGLTWISVFLFTVIETYWRERQSIIIINHIDVSKKIFTIFYSYNIPSNSKPYLTNIFRVDCYKSHWCETSNEFVDINLSLMFHCWWCIVLNHGMSR